MKQAESRCRLIRMTVPSEKVTSMLVRLWPQADCWIVPEDVLLTPELLLWLSVTLVKRDAAALSWFSMLVGVASIVPDCSLSE